MWYPMICTDGTGYYWSEAVRGWENTHDSAQPSGFVKVVTVSPFTDPELAFTHAERLRAKLNLRNYLG